MEKGENLHEGHRKRMRDRFLVNGFEGFEPHQIIEMLLFYVCPRRDTNELAHILINKFGSIAGIMNASFDELVSVKGISENAAVLFKMIPQFMPLYFSLRAEEESYDNIHKLKDLFMPYFIGLNKEEFRVACFDNNLRMLSNICVAKGAPSFAPVELRAITVEALRVNAPYIAVAHNHPKGLPTPSSEDVSATRMINSVMRSLGVTLLDHIIVGEHSAASMRELAYINVFD